ncbi:MAG TPA: hypothetical protein VGX37_02650 [Allosphingosinicella sp.]|jgi:hypothetical protein|nr:hypothetical protein [Allosphingosinicella sp.]
MALTPEQREIVIRAARNRGIAEFLVKSLNEAGLATGDQLSGLFTAAVVIIETNYGPAERLHVLNALMAETITAWADDAFQPSPGTRVQ